MRLCRIGPELMPRAAFYLDDGVLPLEDWLPHVPDVTPPDPLPSELIEYLPGGHLHALAVTAFRAIPTHDLPELVTFDQAELLVPIAKPNKLLLLAGNYAEHVRERGYMAAERAETFPYVFMKPPSTSLNHPANPVRIPALAPNEVDWELELAVVIGRRCKDVSEEEALAHVAGYTIINDITQRKFRPNPGRKKRERDAFFDWQHGKWFDGFCPCGPCITSADAIADPQTLAMQLTLNGTVRQDGSTAQMVFPVAAVIAFIASMMTLEPGDLISTGTPAGVGHTTGTYLKAGDLLQGTIAGIGTLETRFVAE